MDGGWSESASSSSFYTPFVQCFTEGRQPGRVLHYVGKECAHAPHGLVPKLMGGYFVALHTGAGPERSCPQEHGSNNQVHLSAWRTDTHHHQGCGSNTSVGFAPLRELYCCLRVNLSGQSCQMATQQMALWRAACDVGGSSRAARATPTC